MPTIPTHMTVAYQKPEAAGSKVGALLACSGVSP